LPGRRDASKMIGTDGSNRNSMRLNRWIGALGLALVMAAATGEGAEADPGKLARADCWFEAPAKIAARCYHLNVPESRSGRSELTIELPVVVISVPTARKHDDPVIYLAGGPGDGAWLDADRIDFWWEFVADNAWLNERDLVLMDQRGTGMSTPRMDCREQESAQVRSLGFGLNRAAARQAWINAAAECRARVEKEGHDPLSYTSRDSATDLHDLMNALKLQHWNIYGLSYGTRLALTYVRDYPHDVRSLILDSVYLPESAFLEDDAWRTDRAFRVLFDGCRQDAECNGWYPGGASEPVADRARGGARQRAERQGGRDGRAFAQLPVPESLQPLEHRDGAADHRPVRAWLRKRGHQRSRLSRRSLCRSARLGRCAEPVGRLP
jgi:pimeloyl-ACP methyl ester carboxylesterase